MLRLTKSMINVINEIKKEMLEMQNSKLKRRIITKKPTKKKKFIAQAVLSNIPSFNLYINGKFYAMYTLKNESWEEWQKES